MKLQDLKYGMYVELRNGDEGIVTTPPFTTRIKIETINSYHYRYNQNLEDEEYEEFDIIKVLDNNRNIIWKRKEFKYPIYKRSKVSGIIVRFDKEVEGEVVCAGINYTTDEVGDYCKCWVSHKNTNSWEEEDVLFDEERGLFDKQLVLCWNNGSKFSRGIRFYDAKNKQTFYSVDGTRNGASYTYYEPFEGEYPQWAKDAYKHLED